MSIGGQPQGTTWLAPVVPCVEGTLIAGIGGSGGRAGSEPSDAVEPVAVAPEVVADGVAEAGALAVCEAVSELTSLITVVFSLVASAWRAAFDKVDTSRSSLAKVRRT